MPKPSSNTLLKSLLTTVLIISALWSGSVISEEASNEEAQTSNETGTEKSRQVPNAESIQQQALAEAVDDEERVWLDAVYPEHNTPARILGLEQKPRQPDAQGAVLILHDKEQHADWPLIVRPLRQSLPDSGWYTLTINLPLHERNTPPVRQLEPKKLDQVLLNEQLKTQLASPANRSTATESSDVAKESSENSTSADTTDDLATAEGENVDINLSEANSGVSALPYEDRATAHIKAGMDHIATNGYRNNIMIAIGQSADLALNYLQPKAASMEARGFALILVDAKLENKYQKDISKALGEGFQAPVLDIVNGAIRDDQGKAKRRIKMARAANILGYQQIQLPALEGDSRTLLKRIDSWLRVYAPGMAAMSLKNR